MRESGFADRYTVRPETWKDWRTAAAKDWRDQALAAGLHVLVPSDLDVIRGIAKRLAADPFVKNGVFDGEPELSIVWQDRETGVWLKARPDVTDLSARVINDLKTTTSADGLSCRKAIGDFGYHVQLGLAVEGLMEIGAGDFSDGCMLTFAEKRRPYCVNVKPIDPNAIWTGRQIVRRAVRTFAECVKTGEWPGYDDSGRTTFLPAWLEKRMEEETKAGLLPEPLHIG